MVSKRTECIRPGSEHMISSTPRISPGDIQAWTCSLDILSEADLSHNRELFDAVDWDRAGRFAFPLHRNRFLACRLALRYLLGVQLDIAPSEVRLCFGADGKPAIDSRRHHSDLTFNLSHCEGTALIVLACGQQVGVDLEDETREIEFEEVGDRMFSFPERRKLRELRGAEQAAFFFRCWTAREAYLKCVGKGLVVDPGEFSVAGVDRERPSLTDRYGNANRLQELRPLRLAFPHVGMIAIEGAVEDVVVHELSWSSVLRDIQPLSSGSQVRGSNEDERAADRTLPRENVACIC